LLSCKVYSTHASTPVIYIFFHVTRIHTHFTHTHTHTYTHICSADPAAEKAAEKAAAAASAAAEKARAAEVPVEGPRKRKMNPRLADCEVSLALT
jgi:hypothetical protein